MLRLYLIHVSKRGPTILRWNVLDNQPSDAIWKDKIPVQINRMVRCIYKNFFNNKSVRSP